ncbi:MAG: hypothetical protein H6741_27300 [Alphaproteobacteria bacterium]|nr:hypothetical protein [Alphaproteobacteria bacterium]
MTDAGAPGVAALLKGEWFDEVLTTQTIRGLGLGMGEEDAIVLLGDPVETDGRGNTRWLYYDQIEVSLHDNTIHLITFKPPIYSVLHNANLTLNIAQDRVMTLLMLRGLGQPNVDEFDRLHGFEDPTEDPRKFWVDVGASRLHLAFESGMLVRAALSNLHLNQPANHQA